MKSKHDQAYAQIARSCLNVLNNINPAMDREQQIAEVYAAIDNAIADLYKKQEQDLANAYAALNAIAALNPESEPVSKAITIAQKALPTQH